jgi:aminodeoxyfutalosine synthase
MIDPGLWTGFSVVMPTSERLSDIAGKVEAGLRLGFDEGVRLFSSRDFHEIGRLADLARRRKNGRAAYYVINRHINYTNYCVFRCKFCGFRRAIGRASDGGYQLTVEQIVAQAQEAYLAGASEVHIVGGLHPKLPFEYYVDMIRSIRQTCPRIHIKAFTAIEIVHLGHMARPRLDIAGVLSRLREAGLDSLPGGGAEIFDERVHDEAFKHKVGQDAWFAVHRIAHEMGIPSNATMLYGHIETPAERVGHMVKLRRHQDASMIGRRAHFQCMVPLPFVPAGTEWSDRPGPTGLESLKTLAIARLMLDNFAHIKAFWPMMSPKLAQVALSFGVDDLDGTVQHYDITHRDGAPSDKQALSVDALRRLIIETGHLPVQRDSLYRPVEGQR